MYYGSQDSESQEEKDAKEFQLILQARARTGLATARQDLSQANLNENRKLAALDEEKEEASQAALKEDYESALAAVKSAEAIVASASTELETMQQLVRKGLEQARLPVSSRRRYASRPADDDTCEEEDKFLCCEAKITSARGDVTVTIWLTIDPQCSESLIMPLGLAKLLGLSLVGGGERHDKKEQVVEELEGVKSVAMTSKGEVKVIRCEEEAVRVSLQLQRPAGALEEKTQVCAVRQRYLEVFVVDDEEQHTGEEHVGEAEEEGEEEEKQPTNNKQPTELVSDKVLGVLREKAEQAERAAKQAAKERIDRHFQFGPPPTRPVPVLDTATVPLKQLTLHMLERNRTRCNKGNNNQQTNNNNTKGVVLMGLSALQQLDLVMSPSLHVLLPLRTQC